MKPLTPEKEMMIDNIVRYFMVPMYCIVFIIIIIIYCNIQSKHYLNRNDISSSKLCYVLMKVYISVVLLVLSILVTPDYIANFILKFLSPVLMILIVIGGVISIHLGLKTKDYLRSQKELEAKKSLEDNDKRI